MNRTTWPSAPLAATILALAGLLPPTPAAALDDEKDIRHATSTYFGDTGLFHVSSAYTLREGNVAFNLFRDNLDRDPKDIDFSIHGISIAYGVTSRLELFGQIGIQNRVDADAPQQAGYFNDLPQAGLTSSSGTWQTGLGDTRLGAKYGILSDYRGDPLGLAVKASIKLPTADDAKGLGTGAVSFDAHVVASKSLGRSADIHGSIGYEWNKDPDGYKIGNALKLAIGLNIPSCRRFQLQAELLYTKYQNYVVAGGGGTQTNPLDFVVGPVIFFTPAIYIRPALSGNLNFENRGADSSSSSWLGRQITVGYHPGTLCRMAAAPPPPPPPPSNHPPTVSCDVDKTSVSPGERVRCHATGSDPDGDPLTYEWSASVGSISGAGTEATWDSSQVAPGSSAAVTVQVSDGRGRTAQSTCPIVVEKPKALAAVTCTSGSFPLNGDRLNNVDKACLDDVASRLKQDPRAHVAIIGHADINERHPEVIGRKRAEAVKAYLAQERGIDQARISVRSEGARKPLDIGTNETAHKENRRVEVVFLPEGATSPE